MASVPAWTVGANPGGGAPVFVIPISGTVEPAMAAFLQRTLRDIEGRPAALIVVEMDTFGGRVDAALEMVDTLVHGPKAKTVALVTQKAISAGALIALACNRLVMRHHTTIGDCAPIIYSQEGPKMVGEKFQSPLRAKFRTLARRNGYPVALAEAMVTAEMEVLAVTIDGETRYMEAQDFEELDEETRQRVESKSTVVPKGELLTMDDAEARQFGFSSMSVSGLDEMLERMELSGHPVERLDQSWSESLVRTIASIAPILMAIGLAALYMEFQAPGFGAPGIIGILALGLVFFNQYLVGLADYTELLLIVIGLLLLGFEMFVIPGFGIAGITALLVISAGLLLSLQDFVLPDPEFPWQQELMIRNLTQVLAAVVAAIVASIVGVRYLLPKSSRLVSGPYLDATLQEARDLSDQTRTVQVGDTGLALSFLRPSGKADISGELLDVISEAEFIEKDTPIRVVDVRGNRIVVERKAD
ncbi:MAG: serine protease [Desulfobacteraceae bacterium]|nr:serine protease [Desulfobacteraceae bacterium]